MQLSRHLATGFWTAADKGLVAAYGVFMLVVIRVLPRDQFGEYLFVQYTFLTLSSLSVALGMGPYVKYFYETEDRTALQSGALVLMGSFFAIMSLAILLFRAPLAQFFNSPEFDRLAYFVPLLFLLAFGKLMANEIFRATHEIKQIFFIDFAYYLVNISVILIFILQHRLDTAETLLKINAFAYFFSTLVGFWSVRRHLQFGFHLRGPLLRQMAQFGKFTFGAGVSATVYDRADQYIVSAMLGMRELALIGAVKLFLRLYDLFKQAVTLVAFPAFARLYAEKRTEDIRSLYEKGVFYANVFLLAIMIFLFLGAEFFFDVILAGKYPEGAMLLRVFSLLGLLIGWQTVGEGALFGIGEAGFAFAARSVATVSSLFFNVLLIRWYGVLGAALASLLSIGLLAALVTLRARRSVGWRWAGIWQRRKDLAQFLRERRAGKTANRSAAE